MNRAAAAQSAAPRWASPWIWAPLAAAPVIITVIAIMVFVYAAPRIPSYENAQRARATATGQLSAPAGGTRAVPDGYALRYAFEVDGRLYEATGLHAWPEKDDALAYARRTPPVTSTAIYDPDDPRRAYVDDRDAFDG